MAQDLTSNEMMMMDSSSLAYLGDSVFELQVRSRLILYGIRMADELVKASQSYVTATAQASFLEQLMNFFNDDEKSIIVRGKNMKHKSNHRHISKKDYSSATAFECLFGYLFLHGRFERIDELMNSIFYFKRIEI